MWISLIGKQLSSLPEVRCKDRSDENDNEEACQASMRGFKWMTLEFEFLRRLLVKFGESYGRRIKSEKVKHIISRASRLSTADPGTHEAIFSKDQPRRKA